MNKKLLVLAVSSALTGTSALADTVNVNVYGKLYPQYQTTSAKGATQPGTTVSTLVTAPTAQVANSVSRQGVNSQNSYVGFKGDADVGKGLKGWFQVEQSIELETGVGTWSSRNSAAGISGAFGNVFLGNWDTVYKQLGDPVSFLGISSGNFISTSNLISRPGFGSTNSSFHLRVPNNIQYETPVFGGFQFLANYAPDETKTMDMNAYLRDFGVKWEAGPLYLAFANEYHNDFFGASRNIRSGLRNFDTTAGTPIGTARSKDTGNRFSWKYALPSGTTIGGDFGKIEYKETGAATGRFEKYSFKFWNLTVAQKMGNWEFAANYADADEGTCSLAGGGTCTTTGLGGSQVNLGTKFDFSKRVSTYAIYSKLTNDESGRRNNVGSLATVNTGADPEAFAVGIIVSF